MESFLSLFDPNDNDCTSNLDDDFAICSQLPPEPQIGNVEYKLKLVNPTKLRFQHLVTQMKWRLREGQGEAIYEIGVEDGGTLAGLPPDDLLASLQTLEHMAEKLGASCTILRERLLDNGLHVAEVLVRKVPNDRHNIEVSVAVMGSADAGKSTLLGVLTQGQLDNGRGRARLNMFRHLHEVQSGRTSSISQEILGFDSKGMIVNYSELLCSEEICERSSKLITFLDLAGHRKYLKTTVSGLSGYVPHYVMMVVSAMAGIMGMTREHLALARALDVPFFVVVTKVDLTSPSSTVFSIENLLKSTGCQRVPFLIRNEDDVITAGSVQLCGNIVPLFCLSSVTGEGFDLLTKFLHLLPPGVSAKERERLEQEPAEFLIDETFRISEIGTVVGGLLTKGVVTEGSQLSIGPFTDGQFKLVIVQSIHRYKRACRMVRASQTASLSFSHAITGIRNGMVLVSPECSPTAVNFFQASVVVLFHTAKTINRGFQATVHIGSICQTAVIQAVMDPSGLRTNIRALVLFRFTRNSEYVCEGMRLLFREGTTKGIGTVTQVFSSKAQIPTIDNS